MRKYLTTILTIVTISVTSICVYAENITDLQEKSNQINQSITETNNRLQAVQEQMSENMQQLQELDTQLAQSEEELNKINIEVSTLTTQISENEQKLSNAQEKYDKIKKVLDARVIEIYKSDNLQLLGVLFASKNVKEFFQTYDKLILLSKYDKTLLDSAEQQIEEIEVTKKILAEKKKQIVESKQLQQKKTQVVQNSKTKRQYYLSKLTKQEQELQAQIDEYNAQVTQIENEIKLFKTYKYDDAFKDVFYIKKDIDINSLTYQGDEVEYVKYLTKDEILDLINNEDNIRKTNIDAFLELIKSYEY